MPTTMRMLASIYWAILILSYINYHKFLCPYAERIRIAVVWVLFMDKRDEVSYVSVRLIPWVDIENDTAMSSRGVTGDCILQGAPNFSR